MKTFIISLLLLPLLLCAQKQDIYIKLTDAKGNPINGDVVVRGFEKNIYALTFAAAGKNNSQVNFSMDITGASVELKKVMANDQLLMSGLVSVTQIGNTGNPITTFTISMEKIRVQSCTENMGCAGNMTTNVILQPVRIGWTYYQTGRTGIQTVSNKYGFDAETGDSWVNF